MPGNGNYWDPITATIDWCEPNYEVSPYIAEFYNTISNLSYILLGWYGLYQSWPHELRFRVAFLGLILVGFGSSAFHATLKWSGQLSDEVGMFMVTLSTLYILLQHRDEFHPQLLAGLCTATLFLFTTIYAILQWVLLFQIAWVILAGIVICKFMHLIQQTKRSIQRIYIRIMGLLILSAVMWLLEQLLCESFPIIASWKLHALFWHVGTAIVSYFVLLGCLYCRLNRNTIIIE